MCTLQVAKMVSKYFQELEQKEVKAEKEEAQKLKRIASQIAKQVREFWSNIERVGYIWFVWGGGGGVAKWVKVLVKIDIEKGSCWNLVKFARREELLSQLIYRGHIFKHVLLFFWEHEIYSTVHSVTGHLPRLDVDYYVLVVTLAE